MSIIACSVDGCEKAHYGKTWCRLHYGRMRKTGSLELKPKAPKYCKVETCGAELVPPYGRGMCSLHYRRFMKHGDAQYERPLIVGVAECTIEGCEAIIRARNLCATHYSRWRRKGDPLHRLQGEIVDGKRICPRCGKDKPLSEYTYEAQCPCRPCAAAITAEHRTRFPQPKVVGFPKQCACGETYMANGRRRRYCSTECKARFKNRDNWPHMNKRRATIREAYVETFDRLEIFERDSWVCQLCGEQIDKLLKFPHRKAATLDHIIPISRGGKHERANAQTACHSCNSAKGNRMVA